MAQRDERAFRNDATFLAANERIRAAAEALGAGSVVPFICECDDPRCTAALRLTLAEYEAVRSERGDFLNAPDHEAPRGAEVVRREDRYVVVRRRDA
jgi:hypothetical protein